MEYSLSKIFDGWNGYQTSLVHAIAPLTREQLVWRPAPNLRSVGEVARHVSLGRVTWFARMGAPASAEVVKQIEHWEIDDDSNRDIVEDMMNITEEASQLVNWLELTWQMINETLNTWIVDDLAETYQPVWNGKKYIVSRQWTLWRMLSHDLHHGGELSLMLGLQGIEALELGHLFGHIVLPPLADSSR
jgi:uncharacterized damage-inducible protein DinB